MTATRSLRSYVAMNRASLLRWCEGKWNDHNPLPHESAPREPPPPPLDLTQLASQSFLSEPFSWSLSLTTEEDPRLGHDWWAVKASRGNGGKDVWIVHQDNYLTVIPSLPIGEEYVMQRSASPPSLPVVISVFLLSQICRESAALESEKVSFPLLRCCLRRPHRPPLRKVFYSFRFTEL
jgi:hypothetical protein